MYGTYHMLHMIWYVSEVTTTGIRVVTDRSRNPNHGPDHKNPYQRTRIPDQWTYPDRTRFSVQATILYTQGFLIQGLSE